jgi:transcriptional regulator with XRE-family HTH domain
MVAWHTGKVKRDIEIFLRKSLTKVVCKTTILNMERGTQKKLAVLAGVSPGHLAHILNGKRQASYFTGEKLALITSTPVALWINGSTKLRRRAVEDWFKGYTGANNV